METHRRGGAREYTALLHVPPKCMHYSFSVGCPLQSMFFFRFFEFQSSKYFRSHYKFHILDLQISGQSWCKNRLRRRQVGLQQNSITPTRSEFKSSSFGQTKETLQDDRIMRRPIQLCLFFPRSKSSRYSGLKWAQRLRFQFWLLFPCKSLITTTLLEAEQRAEWGTNGS